MALLDELTTWAKSWISSSNAPAAPRLLPNEDPARSSEWGSRATPENALIYMYRTMWVDPDLRRAVLDIRDMDRRDGRVKRIHARVARDTVKGGLVFTQPKGGEVLKREWDVYMRRLQLNRAEKLKSDTRGFVMEGSLPLQWVLDDQFNVVSAVRMPAETILPDVDKNGRFKDPRQAYRQYEITTGIELASFPLWQLFVARMSPDSFDDMGAMGRPFLDASRTTWRKLMMTEEDLVIRRRTRAPLRMAHVLKGATTPEIEAYRKSVERDQGQITTDYYMNKEGGVTAVAGDSNLDQINDIVHLLDTFFAGSPMPKGLMGYHKDLARDILEDIKRDYYEEIDGIQDEQAFAYDQGFRLHLLLKGINPDDEEYCVKFAERRTETPNQAADRGLKLKALGVPEGMVFEELGYDPTQVQERRKWEAQNYDPYPSPEQIGAPPGARVSITPGNAPKGESATSISNA